MLPTRTLVVWCPDWPVAAAGVAADVPAAVFHANRVVACSAAARVEGVQRGLRRREAQARCPALVVLQHDHARDGRAFEPIVATVEAFAPRVEILRPGVCLVATRGPSRYFGGDEALAAKISAAVAARTQHPCRIGIADGPFAAALAAREGCVVASGDNAGFLAPFPVNALDQPDLADLLARLGIRTLGQFAALRADDVLARFGTEGAMAHRLARGLDERPLAGRTSPPDFVVQMELDPPAQRVDTAAFAGKALADELHLRLARRGLACTRVAVEAETEHGERLCRLWRHEGALTPSAIAERVRWQLDGWLTGRAASSADDDSADDDIEPTGGLVLLRLVPDEVVPDDGRQLGFWGGSGEAGERAARALARVQGMLGQEAVVTAVVGGGRDPVEQVTFVSWGDVREAPRPAPAPPQPAVPLDQLPPPEPLDLEPQFVPQPGGGGRPVKPDGGRRQSLRRQSGRDPKGATAGTGATASEGSPASKSSTASTSSKASTARTRARTGTGTGTTGTSTTNTSAPKRTPAREREAPAWPGHLPRPSPATVYSEPVPAQLLDADGRPVAVTGRQMVTAPPVRLSINGGRWMDLEGWAGPWPVDERWWDPPAHRRRARFHAVNALGVAYLLSVEKGTWWIEAVYD